MKHIKDASQRESALDISKSFIVQAPAGSGKTELLTQRYLRLLAHVESYPEQILAITFTKKAQGEMRQRISNALQFAVENPEPIEPHKKTTWQLAQAVIERDLASSWGLLDNPNRLYIQTIDALCAGLANRLPMLSEIGKLSSISEEKNIYEIAAVNFLNASLNNPEYSTATSVLLSHLNNRFENAVSMIAQLLANRDQWLAYCIQAKQEAKVREALESSILQLNFHGAMQLLDALPAHLISDWHHFAVYAGKHLRRAVHDSPPECHDLNKTSLELLKFMVDLVLTKTGELRKTANKKIGFPAPSEANGDEEKQYFKQMKGEFIVFLQDLATDNSVIDIIKQFSRLPDLHYDEQEWAVLSALLTCLPMAVAHLHVIFQQQNKTDFLEVSLRALRSLGDSDSPTDLALALDYRFQHILVDEFQDTSHLQWVLLEKLTASWSPEDERTLFLVGDPMQSIYRFRNADVGLFLRAKNSSINNIPIESIKLSTNFRSNEVLVNFCNQLFSHIFPQKENRLTGSVLFEHSSALLDNPNSTVSLYQCSGLEEANQAVEIIKQNRLAHTNDSIAILVRSRSHIVNICQQLHQAKIQFKAVEIDALLSKPVCQDILMLTRALLHEGDKIAWLALLRSPFVGLTIKDLTQLIEKSCEHSVLSICLNNNSEPRLKIIHALYRQHWRLRGRVSYVDLIKSAWSELGGDQYYAQANQYEDVRVFFAVLAALEKRGALPHGERLNQEFSNYFSSNENEAKNPVQLMTIHKSKGLEFDTVIVPHLGAKPRATNRALLAWLEYETAECVNFLLSTNSTNNKSLYEYIRDIQSAQLKNETYRLLYVALTRAKSHIHLLGALNEHKNMPEPGSFLSLGWPYLESIFPEKSVFNEKYLQKTNPQSIVRVDMTSYDWGNTKSLGPDDTSNNSSDIHDYRWQQECGNFVGSFIHRVLFNISVIGYEKFFSCSLNHYLTFWKHYFRSQGFRKYHLKVALNKMTKLYNVLSISECAQWIFSKKHHSASSEWPLSVCDRDEIKHMVIDRTFIDEKGTRWIIDYKSNLNNENLKPQDFLRRQWGQHKKQLRLYAKTLATYEKNPIKMLLYFPLLDHWVSADYVAKSQSDQLVFGVAEQSLLPQ